MVKAKWKHGFETLHKADAQAVAEEIISIGDDATPEQIVEKARDETTELNKCFTWDNDVAADKWRLQEARQIVCHLVIQQEESDKKQPEVRFFFKPKPDGGYVQTTTIFKNEDKYVALLMQALGELIAFQRKYTILKDRQGLLALIEELEAMIQKAS